MLIVSTGVNLTGRHPWINYERNYAPLPNSRANSVLSQILIHVTFCTELVWFTANSVIHSEWPTDSEEYFSEFFSVSKKLRKHFTVGSEIFLNQY